MVLKKNAKTKRTELIRKPRFPNKAGDEPGAGLKGWSGNSPAVPVYDQAIQGICQEEM
jgi:hypothetical protein